MAKNKVKVAVSVLNSNFLNLGSEIKKIEDAGADMVHLDVMDGGFVPNISIGLPMVKAMREGTGLFLDVHLMINEPDKHIDNFIKSGADLITVHVETCPHLDRTLNHIKDSGARASVALNPSTPLCTIENVLGLLDMVLIMTVNPGFGGQKFIEAMIYKIKKLNSMIENYRNRVEIGKSINIQVDGGINEKTAPIAIKAGADVLVMGTSFFKSKDPNQLVNNVKSTLLI